MANCDELYSRMKAFLFAQRLELEIAMDEELGISKGKLREFMDYIKPYVSQEVINAEKPREYPTGYRIR